jgi:hypothetical protein
MAMSGSVERNTVSARGSAVTESIVVFLVAGACRAGALCKQGQEALRTAATLQEWKDDRYQVGR